MKIAKEKLLRDIQYSINNNDQVMLKELIKDKENLNYLLSISSPSFLHIACEKGLYMVVQVLLEHGSNPDLAVDLGNTKGVTPLYLATRRGSADTVRQLVKVGVNLEKSIEIKTSTKGVTPLYLAIDKGFEDIAIVLIKAGANPNSVTSTPEVTDNSALHLACVKGLGNVVKELIEAGANINAVRKGTNVTPLYLAAQNGDVELVKLLLDAGAHVENDIKSYDQPIDIAIEKGHTEIVQLFIGKNASLKKAGINIKLIVKNILVNNNETEILNSDQLKNPYAKILKLIKEAEDVDSFMNNALENFMDVNQNISNNYSFKNSCFNYEDLPYLKCRASLFFINNFDLEDINYIEKLKYFNKLLRETDKNNNLYFEEIFFTFKNSYYKIFNDSENTVPNLFTLATKSLLSNDIMKLANLGHSDVVEKIFTLPLSFRPTITTYKESILKALDESKIVNPTSRDNSFFGQTFAIDNNIINDECNTISQEIMGVSSEANVV